MKFYLLLGYLCIIIPKSFAQSPELTLTGKLDVNTGETFPYKLVFTEANGILKGYSYTFNEPGQTKSAINGTLDRRRHTLSFRETAIVYSRGIHTKAYMCLIDAIMEDATGPNGEVLSGLMNNAESDRIACTGGTITFNNMDELQRIFASQEKFDTVISMKRKPAATPLTTAYEPAAKTAAAVTDKITANIEKTYDWHSDTVIIDVWDGGSEDGDMVTLLYNGETQLVHYTLLKQKKRIRIPLSGYPVDTITILAENEGFEPPNTASIMLTDGAIQHNLLAYNAKGKQAVIKIRRVK